MMFIADAHCDFLSKAARGADFYSQQSGQHISKYSVIKGNIGLISFAVFGGSIDIFDSKLEFVQEQIECYRKLVKSTERIAKIPETTTYCCLTFEGLDYIENIGDIELVLKNKPLSVGIMWNNPNALGGSCHFDAPLTKLGKLIVKKLDKNNIAIDLSHSGEKTINDIFDCIDKPYASHANAFNVYNNIRNLKEEHIKMLINRKSFMGITFYAPFIGENSDYSQLFKHINYVLDMGGEDILGFGSDFDGCESLVNGSDSTEIYNEIIEEMHKRNYNAELINKLTHKNYYRYFSYFEQKINTCQI